MRQLVDGFFRLLEALVVLCLVAMVIMVFGNVVLRYGFNSGITVSDEMSRYCFIWLTYIGAMVAMREKGHLGVDTLVLRLPLLGKKVCYFLSEWLMLLCNLLFDAGFGAGYYAAHQWTLGIAMLLAGLATPSRRMTCRALWPRWASSAAISSRCVYRAPWSASRTRCVPTCSTASC